MFVSYSLASITPGYSHCENLDTCSFFGQSRKDTELGKPSASLVGKGDSDEPLTDGMGFITKMSACQNGSAVWGE